MTNFREKIIKWGTYFLIFILPILYFDNLIFPYVTSKTFFLYGAVELIFSLWLYTIYVDKTYRLTKKQLIFFIPAILYILWMTLAGIIAINPQLSFWSSLGRGTGLITLYHTLALSFVVASLIRRHGLGYLQGLFKWSFVGASILALSIWFGNEGFTIPIKALAKSGGGGLIGNSSLAGSYFIFHIFFGFYLLFIKKINKIQKISIYLILLIILLSPLFVDFYGIIKNTNILGSARGATLGIIVGLGFAFLSWLVLSKKKITKIIGIILMVISLAVFSVGWLNLMKPDTKLHQKFTEVAMDTRFIFWKIAQKSINDHPWFGYGPENYMIAYQKNFDPQILKKESNFEVWDDRAHNIYFDTGVSGGYPAIAFYFIFLSSLFCGLYVINKKGTISNIQTSLLAGLIVGYTFQNLFVFDSVISLVILFSLMGIIYGLLDGEFVQEKKVKRKRDNSGRGIMATILMIMFILAFYFFCYSPFNKAYRIKYVMSESLNKRFNEYPRLLGGSRVGDYWDLGSIAQGVYQNYISYIKDSKINEKNIDYVRKDISSYIKYLEEVGSRNKNDYRLHLNILNLQNTLFFIDKDLASNQEFIDHVKGSFKSLEALSPNNPQNYWAQASFYSKTNEAQSVYDSLLKAISLEPANRTSWQMMLNFAKSTGNKDFYNKTLEEARKNVVNFNEEGI